MDSGKNIYDLLNELEWAELSDIDDFNIPDELKDTWAEFMDELRNYSREYGNKGD
jgi:hypothetical protein